MKLSEIPISKNCPMLGVSNGHCSCLQQSVDPHSPAQSIAGSDFICCSQCTCLDAIEHLVEIHKSMFQRWQGHTSEVSNTSAAVSTSVILSYLSWIEQVWSVKREYWILVQVCSSSEHSTKISVKYTDILTRHRAKAARKTNIPSNLQPAEQTNSVKLNLSTKNKQPKANKA